MAKRSTSQTGNTSLIALGKVIRAERKKLGLAQESLAFEAGLDRSYLGGVERGEHNLSLVNIIKISEALNIKAYKLMEIALI
jgi:transcriptional regulator with XRE-family HTH domain